VKRPDFRLQQQQTEIDSLFLTVTRSSRLLKRGVAAPFLGNDAKAPEKLRARSRPTLCLLARGAAPVQKRKRRAEPLVSPSSPGRLISCLIDRDGTWLGWMDIHAAVYRP